MAETTLREKIAKLEVYMPSGLPKRYCGTDLADSILSLILSEIDKGKLTVIEQDLIWDKWMKTPHITGINSMDKLMEFIAAAQLEAIKKQLRGEGK